MDLAARRGLPLVLLDLEPLDAFKNLDSMQAHFYAKVVLQVHLGDVFNNLTVDTDLLYINIGRLIGGFSLKATYGKFRSTAAVSECL